MVEMVVILIIGLMFGWLLVVLIMIGIIIDSFRLIILKLVMFSVGQGLNSVISMFSVVSEFRLCSNGVLLMCLCRWLLNSCFIIIVVENVVKFSVVICLEVFRMLCRNSVFQLVMLFLEMNVQRISRFRLSKVCGGKVKLLFLCVFVLFGFGGSNVCMKNGRFSRLSVVRMRKCQNGVSLVRVVVFNVLIR